MLKINHYITVPPEWYNAVIQGMRNSWESWEKSDSYIEDDTFVLGSSDKGLAQRLTKAGDDHGKYIRQIPILYSVTAPDYWFREFDTYVVGNIPPGDVTQNSTSQMHVMGKEVITAQHFNFEDVPNDVMSKTLENLNMLRDNWIESGKKKGPQANEWRALKQSIPDSWLYTRTTSANYMVLRHMYHARKNHRLSEWREFCTWIETLPHADLLTEC